MSLRVSTPRDTTAPSSVVEGLVSVILLSFNRKEETLDCLRSLEAQTYREREIIILENASSDGSQEVLAAWPGDAILLQMSRNHGDWEGRDIALRQCRGEFVLIVDNDASLESDCIEKLVKALQGERKLACVQPRIIDPATGEVYNAGFGRQRSDIRFYKAVFHGCVTLFRAEMLRKAGGFPHYLLGGAEDYISLCFHDQGLDILYEPSVVVRHLMSPKERIPYFRLQQQSSQKMRAKMALAPNLAWLLGVFTRANLAFVYHALKRRHFREVAGGILAHLRAGQQALRERRPISKAAFRAYAQRKRHMVEAPGSS